MEVYSIATVGTLTRLTQDVRDSLDPLQGVHFSLEPQTINPFSFLVCSLEPVSTAESNGLSQAARLHLASAIAQAIMTEGEEWYLSRVIARKYRELEPDERAMIQNAAIPIVYPEHSRQADARQIWRATITDEVGRYLSEKGHLNLRGFLLFRLRAFCSAIESAAEQAAERFLMDREYREFVRLLRYFVDIQEPREEEVHVVMQAGGAFRIYNGQKVPIDRHYLGGWAADLVDGEDQYGDLLISALITISPKRVVIHRGGGYEAVNTVISVFEERTEICPGCDLCSGGSSSLLRER